MIYSPTDRWSIHRPTQYWFVACLSKELSKSPKKIRLWSVAIVLFRDENGTPRALLDRCAHRNVPLSEGKCIQGQIQCPYHGWQFDGQGRCRKVPALVGESDHRKRAIPAFATREKQGHVWIFGQPDVSPTTNHFHSQTTDSDTVRYHSKPTLTVLCI